MVLKKFMAMGLSLAMAVSGQFASFDAMAKEETFALYEATDVSMFEYETGIDGLVITYCEDTDGEIVIPSEIDGEPVVEIGEYAFMMHSASSITVPEGVKKICDYAFYDCTNLEILNLPESLEEIGSGAFEGCSSLGEIYLSYNIKSIGDDIFYGCRDDLVVKCYDGSPAMDYVVENGISYESLGETQLDVIKSGQCGENGSNITWEFDRFGTLTIKGQGRMRGWYSEYDTPWAEEDISSDITKVVIESGVETIGEYAFSRCVSIEEVILPETLESIGEHAFYVAESLKTITLPESLTYIGESAFYGCTSLKNIEIPQGVTYLESYTFAYSGLETITVHKTFAGLDNSALSGLSNLTVKGYGPSEIERFCEYGGYTFEKLGDAPVTMIESGTCGYYSSDDLAWEYSSDGTLTINGSGRMEDYYGSNVPWKDYFVCEIVLPGGLESIGNYAFCQFELLEEIKIPQNVRRIGSSAFTGCKNLSKVILPDSVTYLGTSAFSNTAVKRIEIPQSVAFLDSRTDYDTFRRCSDIVIAGYEGTMAQRYAEKTNKTFESLGEPNGNMAFEIEDEGAECSYSMTIDGKLTVNTTGDIQRATYAFEKYHPVVTHLVIGEDVTVISDSGYTYEYAFSDLDMVEKITIPYKVTSIGERAFEVPDPSKVTILGYSGSAAEEYALAKGFMFESLGDAPDEIDSGSCGDNLTWKISRDGTLTISGNGAMYDYEYDYNGGYTTPWYAYRDIITKVVIEHGVTTISYYAFIDCEYISEIYMPYSVIKFDSYTYGAKIYGYTGSYAEEFCNENGNEFESLGEMPEGAVLVDADYGDNHHWTFDTNGVLKISGSGPMPEESSEYFYPWHEVKDSVKEVIIEDGVTTVSSEAFYEYPSLEALTFEGDMETIGSSAFYGCENLSDISFEGVNTFGYASFRLCTSLETLTIPNGAKTIENYAFANCDSLLWAIIPASVDTIENYAFDYNSSDFVIKGYKGSAAEKYAKNVYVNITFESLGAAPLDNEITGTMGTNISWTISTDGILTISGEGEIINDGWGYYTIPWYNHRDYVKSVVIEEGITYICSDAFYNHSELTSVSFPDSLISIGESAFYGCTKLTEVEIPENVLNISGSFYGLEDIITIKGYTNSAAQRYAEKYGFTFESVGVMEIKTLESGECGDNITWTFDNTCTLTISGSGKMYDYQENTVPWRKYANSAETLVLSDDITHIGNNAFSFHEALFEVVLPSELESIGSYAFMGSYNIRGFNIPESVKSIGSYAFYDTYYPIIVYGNPETIGDEAFGYARVFSQKGGSCEEACEKSDGRFYPIRDNGKCGDNVTWDVDVTTGVLNITGEGATYDYKISWHDTSSENYIDGYAPFYEGYGDLLNTINISEGITRLGDNLLYGSGIKKITFPSTLKSIGEYAFSSCGFSETSSGENGFEKIVIPDSVEYIESYAFEYTAVKKLYIGSMTEIDYDAFYMTDATIYSTTDSPAYYYAMNNDMPFVDINIKPSLELVGITCLKSGVALRVNIENYVEGTIFVVLYSEDGKLLDTKMARPGEYINLQGKGYGLVKAFLWNENMMPLCESKSSEVSFSTGGSSSGGGGGSSSGGGGSSSAGGVVGGVVVGGVVAQ